MCAALRGCGAKIEMQTTDEDIERFRLDLYLQGVLFYSS